MEKKLVRTQIQKKQLKAHCEKCGFITRLECNGYHIADRLLEGVMFEIHITDNDIVVVLPKDEYTSGLNINKWQEAMLEDIKKQLPYYDGCQCPKCQDMVILANMPEYGWQLFVASYSSTEAQNKWDEYFSKLMADI